MLSFRSGLCLSAGLSCCLILLLCLLTQGGQAHSLETPALVGVPEATPVTRAAAQMDFGEEGYDGPVYWDTFPGTFQVISSKGSAQEIIPGPGSQVRLIVQLQGEPVAVYQQRLQRTEMDSPASYTAALEAYSAELRVARQQLLTNLDTLGVAVDVRREFSYLFNGMAISVSEGSRSQIAALPQVVGGFPDYQVKVTLDDSVPLIGAPQVWAKTDPSGQAITGAGVRVAIIDTLAGLCPFKSCVFAPKIDILCEFMLVSCGCNIVTTFKNYTCP